MADNNQIDEVALNTLLADGVDAPTAYAASVRDGNTAPTTKGRAAFDAGLVLGLIVGILWLLW